jgi:hypothetical protein
MLRSSRVWLCVVSSCVLGAACRETPTDPLARERKEPLVVADQPPLPEDPVAGKRSELQWKKHLQAEEIERQMIFDRNRMAEHRDLIKRIKDARERLDKPKTPRELDKTREALAPALKELQAGIDAVDKWKNSSRILVDYDALMSALNETYPTARLAAMGGKPAALSDARNSFDGHLRTMNTWLERLEKDQDEAFEEGELE